jgi:hypothetical protein
LLLGGALLLGGILLGGVLIGLMANHKPSWRVTALRLFDQTTVKGWTHSHINRLPDNKELLAKGA